MRKQSLKLVLSDPSGVMEPRPDEWEMSPVCFVVEERLGEGCFGEVYKGVVKGPVLNPKVSASLKNSICISVAIKMLKGDCF